MMRAPDQPLVSPRARRLLRERGLAPAGIRGTGPNGRIVEADVRRTLLAPHPAAVNPAAAGALSPMRRAVAAKVTESFATVPHFYLRVLADVTGLVQLREQTLETIQRQAGHRPTLTDFLLHTMARALDNCPQANRIWQNDAIVQLPSIDVGLVVQVDDGLLVPVFRGADRLSLVELVRQRASRLEEIRAGRLSADGLQGGATSLTNLGRHRVDEFAPIISPPQSSMLAVGRVAERPFAWEGRLALRQTMPLTLAVDHRVMDGVPAAEFLDRIVALLENPFLLLCDKPFRADPENGR